MAPRKRRSVVRVKMPAIATPQRSLSNQAVHVNSRGFPALAGEIYLEIMSYIPAVPIPTPINSSNSYPAMRRTRHETLLSLSQTCRSLRRVFWRYLWQRIEVHEGMPIGDGDGVLEKVQSHRYSTITKIQSYAVELIRQLEIVTVRNPQLAQHVNYLDIFVGDHLIDRVLAELARCLSLFQNLHTIQIDVGPDSRRLLDKVFRRTFKKYSYPQIRNVFLTYLSEPFLVSCPEARRVGFRTQSTLGQPELLHSIIDNCPRLEVLEDCAGLICEGDICKLVVDSFPNLRHIPIIPFTGLGYPSPIGVLTKLSQLQSITLIWHPAAISNSLVISPPGLSGIDNLNRLKQGWIDEAKRILATVQRRDKLEKCLTVAVKNAWDSDNVIKTISVMPFESDSGELLTL